MDSRGSQGAERTISRHGDGFATPRDDRSAFYFDFVDPVSFVVANMVEEAGAATLIEWRGLELRPPPGRLIDPNGAAWRVRHSRALELAECVGAGRPPEPTLLPWTRKAHELCEFARERDCAHRVRHDLFRAGFVDHVDIGRIDSLVDIAVRAGLDRTETKAVLDVDRYTGAVLANRKSARTRGIADVPALVSPTGSLVDSGALGEITSWIERCTQYNG